MPVWADEWEDLNLSSLTGQNGGKNTQMQNGEGNKAMGGTLAHETQHPTRLEMTQRSYGLELSGLSQNTAAFPSGHCSEDQPLAGTPLRSGPLQKPHWEKPV